MRQLAGEERDSKVSMERKGLKAYETLAHSKWAIFDIDGTLSDCGDRLHHLENTDDPNRWDDFHSEMSNDPPNEAVVSLAQMTGDKYWIAIVTGRPRRYEPETREWLEKYQIPYDALFMRGDTDYRPSAVFKRSVYLKKLKSEGRKIVFAVEDQKSIVEMWREEGIFCFSCRE